MKNTLRKFLVISLCLFTLLNSVSAQSESTERVAPGSEIEKTMTIPQVNTGFEDQDNSNDSGTGSSFWILFRMILVLAVICVLIWGIGKLLKKKMEPGAEPDLYLKKTAQLTLAPGRTIQVVTLRDRAYVLGVSEGGISVIDKIDGKGDSEEKQGKVADKELIDDMNLRAAENLTAKPMDFASMISSFSNSSKRTENFLKSKTQKLKNNGER